MAKKKTDLISDKYNKIFGISDSYEAPAKIMEILYNREEREKVFKELLELHDYNVNFDWFYEYFQEEHSDRKKKKQDFTPESVAELLSQLAGTDEGLYYECCAGTGGIMIKYWDKYRRTFSPFDYTPDLHFAVVEELSDRCIPFLLLNMMIRGMNGIVIHGDTLTRKCKNAYFICNQTNDHLSFSGISNIPHTEEFEKELAVKFESPDYTEHKELMNVELIGKLVKGTDERYFTGSSREVK
ncbi:N-6 DNA methylase [Clostridium perfringens]|nr:N-6 DNA methylase [Clostridium perfringens]